MTNDGAMAIDTPARLAILGGGPIGLEAALYARFLGYDVVVYERGEVANAVRQCGHVRLFVPFAACRSTLGLAAIQAQDESYQPAADDALLTGRQWIDRYLLPLSQTDLIADHLRLRTTVLAVSKEELLAGDMAGNPDRGDWSFRVLSRGADGRERIDVFDGVLDCTGLFGQANWLGHGGIPAVGELELRDQIEYRLPDILGADRPKYAGRHTLLIGAGCSAATNVVALAELVQAEPGTRVTWISRREGPAGAGGPLTVIDNDLLPPRKELMRRANALAASETVAYWPRTVVERVSRPGASGPYEVELSGEHAGPLQVNEIIASVGFRPDNRLYEELHVRQDTPTQQITSASAARPPPLFSGEPNYYILGSKSRGRRGDFLFADGLAQIRRLFAILGDRETLDLYASFGPRP